MDGQHFHSLLEKIRQARNLLPTDEVFQKFAGLLEASVIRILELRFTELTPQKLEEETLSFHDCVQQIVQLWINSNPTKVVDHYIARINNSAYAYQGGTGHYVHNNPRNTCHWVIRPAFYEICKPVPVEQLCMLVDKRKPEISPRIETERWGN